MKETLLKILKNDLKITTPIKSLDKLHGDASYRAYYRLTLADGKTFIIMQMPEGKSSVSEEITNLKTPPPELPYINVGRFLKKLSIPVPAIHLEKPVDNLLVLEDLGDMTIGKVILGGERVKWYKMGLELMTTMQRRTRGIKNGCISFKRSFDETLYNWEFDHFLEFGIEARLHEKLAKKEAEIFRIESRKISGKIAALPRYFTHRDFQSRNLMVVGQKLYLIDFQDALLGPVEYDLVSFLRDSYVALPKNELDQLLSYYFDLSKDYLGEDAKELRRNFDLITVQRKLKDTGRFVYIDRVKKNPNFLIHIPSSLAYVKEAFERLDDCRELYNLLKRYVPEWSS